MIKNLGTTNRVLKQEPKTIDEVKTEEKSDEETDVASYLSRFDTEAAGYVLDELPVELVKDFLKYFQ